VSINNCQKEPTARFPDFHSAIRTPEGIVTDHAQENRSTIIGIAAGVGIALLLVLFTVGGGHNSGKPSGAEGNPMQSDQGR